AQHGRLHREPPQPWSSPPLTHTPAHHPHPPPLAHGAPDTGHGRRGTGPVGQRVTRHTGHHPETAQRRLNSTDRSSARSAAETGQTTAPATARRLLDAGHGP